MVQQMLGLPVLAFLMEIAMAVWPDNSDGVCVVVVSISWHPHILLAAQHLKGFLTWQAATGAAYCQEGGGVCVKALCVSL